MSEPFISFLVTCKNSDRQLKELLSCIERYIDGNECVILDDFSDSEFTAEILHEYGNKTGFKVYQHHLNKNYSLHKNHGKEKCSGKWIFQLDDDELPTETLLTNIKDIIESNPDVDVFLIPRINMFAGVTEAHARTWGWQLREYNGQKIVNWPDYQFRLFQNVSHLNWERPLHEKVEGAKIISKLPMEFDLAIEHRKTIERQVETNLRYNKEFSEDLNKGFKI